MHDVEAEAGAEGDEGGEAEPPDPSAVQGGDQRVVGGSVVAGGVQEEGETSGLVDGGALVAIPPLPEGEEGLVGEGDRLEGGWGRGK